MTFATIVKVVATGDNICGLFTANESISAGMVVGHTATGVSWSLDAMDGTEGERPVGVAVYGAKSTDALSVAIDGCICYVMADATTDAGDYVEASNLSNAGAVLPVADIANASTNTSLAVTYTKSMNVVGQAMEDIAAGATGRIIVRPDVYQKIAAA